MCVLLSNKTHLDRLMRVFDLSGLDFGINLQVLCASVVYECCVRVLCTSVVYECCVRVLCTSVVYERTIPIV